MHTYVHSINKENFQSSEIFETTKTQTLTEELQDLLVAVFHLENQIKILNKTGPEKKEALRQMNCLRDKLQQIEKQLYQQPQHKKTKSCYPKGISPKSNTSNYQSFRKNLIIPSVPINILKISNINQNIPQVQIRLKCEPPPMIVVNNPREILESEEDSLKKQSKWSSYNLSFSSNPVLEPMFGQYSKIDQTQLNFNSSIFNFSNTEISKLAPATKSCLIEDQGILVFVKGETQEKYDAIEDYWKNPADFGYETQRIQYDSSEKCLNFYRHSQHLDVKENMGSYFYLVKKISKIISFNIGICSESAIKFKKIYRRIGCNESVALKHLKIRYFPFFINYDKKYLECLASSQEDLQILQQYFDK